MELDRTDVSLTFPPEREYASQMNRERAEVLALLSKYDLNLKKIMEVSDFKSIWYFAYCYGSLVLSFAIWTFGSLPWAWIGIVMIPFLQHAFFNTVHEASHFLLSSNPRKNDFLGNFFAFPIGTTTESYRIVHVDHHRYLNSKKDPSSATTQLGRPTKYVVRHLMLSLFGRYLVLLLRSALMGRAEADSAQAQGVQRKRFWLMVLFHLSVMVTAVWLGVWSFWLAWVVSANSFLPLLESIRTLVEHRPLKTDRHDLHTRTHHRNVFLSGITAPFFQYHWEHHLFPSVPHYTLKHVHEILVHEGRLERRPKLFYSVLVEILTER